MRVYDNKINLWNEGGLPEGISLEALKRSRKSKPRNLLIADVCFKGGLIDAWGRGTISIIDSCKAAGLPEPELIEEDGGFMVTLFKNRFTEEQLQQLGLNERQIKAVLYVKEKGKITNKEYQEINQISNRTATYELKELVDKFDILRISGASVGTFYELP
jgi:ATP-dependent DNA helicase RecG